MCGLWKLNKKHPQVTNLTNLHLDCTPPSHSTIFFLTGLVRARGQLIHNPDVAGTGP
mgnify:CR=1 FL=1